MIPGNPWAPLVEPAPIVGESPKPVFGPRAVPAAIDAAPRVFDAAAIVNPIFYPPQHAEAAPEKPAHTVPEPSSLAVLAVGLVGLIAARSKH